MSDNSIEPQQVIDMALGVKDGTQQEAARNRGERQRERDAKAGSGDA